MALGATPSLVSRLFLGKALLIGLAGGVLGYVIRHGARRWPGAELGRRRGAAGAVAGGHCRRACRHRRTRRQLFAGAACGADRSLSLFP